MPLVVVRTFPWQMMALRLFTGKMGLENQDTEDFLIMFSIQEATVFLLEMFLGLKEIIQ